MTACLKKLFLVCWLWICLWSNPLTACLSEVLFWALWNPASMFCVFSVIHIWYRQISSHEISCNNNVELEVFPFSAALLFYQVSSLRNPLLLRVPTAAPPGQGEPGEEASSLGRLLGEFQLGLAGKTHGGRTRICWRDVPCSARTHRLSQRSIRR